MMKKLLATVFLIVLSVALLTQTPAQAGSKAKRSISSRIEAQTMDNPLTPAVMASEAAVKPAELAIAERVYQGKLPCELGASVTLTADAAAPGYFDVQIQNQKYRMFPVETSTGVIRLEDHRAGAVWLQLANKSMLMNQKLGRRLADECMSPDQAVMAENLLKNPAPSILDSPVEFAAK